MIYQTLRGAHRLMTALSSRLLFTSFQPLITLSQHQKLQAEHMFPLPEDMRAREVLRVFQISWNIASHDKKQHRMFHAFHHMIFYDFWQAGAYRLISDILVIVCAVMIKYIVQAANTSDFQHISSLAIAYFVLSFSQAICLQQFIDGCFRTGARVVAAATASVFHATLRLKMRSMSFTAGEVNNIQGKDAASLREFVVFAHNLWACPLTIVLCIVALTYIVGWVGLLCFVFLVTLLPLESRIANAAKRYRKDTLNFSDKRSSLLHEMIDGIKTLKFSGYLNVQQGKVEELRNNELQGCWQSVQLEILNSVLSQATPVMVTLLTIIVYVWTHNDSLSAANAFTVLAVINILGRPIKVLPKTISLYAAALVSLERIENYIATCFNDHVVFDEYDNRRSLCLAPLVQCRNVSVTLHNRSLLSDINFSIHEPGLVLVLGSNKSGKTTLLLTLLQEVSYSGEVVIKANSDRVAYCGHEPWIRNATAFANITCASPDSMFAYHAIQACQLQPDFDAFPQREHTPLGERGILISGGQKARISLARAICSTCNVILLDNPLSALDATVSAEVFHQAVLKASENAIVIMTTHDNSLLQFAKHIILLSNDGRVEYSGTYEAMQSIAYAKVYDNWKSHMHISDVTTKSDISNVKSGNIGSERDVSADHDFGTLMFHYATACGVLLCLSTVLLSIGCYAVGAYTDVVLARYTDKNALSTSSFQLSYTVCSLAVIAVTLVRYYVGMVAGLRGSISIHRQLLHSIVHGTMSFFSSTASGRILTRFTSDMEQIDNSIPSGVISTIDAFLSVLVPIVVSVYGVPMYIFFIAPLAYYYVTLRNLYRSPSRELKRIDGGNKSPMYSHFKEVLSGLDCVRAYHLQAKMLNEHYEFLDNCTQSRYNWDICNRWLGVRLDIIGTLIVTLAILSIAIYGKTTAGTTGLVVSYAVKATNNLSFAIRASTALESVLLALERVVQYIFTIPQEKVSSTDVPVQRTPGEDIMTLKDVCVRYNNDLPFVLRGVNLTLRKGRLIGICGRTGCGKSTLSLTLTRGIDLCGGSILYGKHIISTIPLSQYRTAIVQVFPQDSFIFSGVLRDILDPARNHSDILIAELLNRFSRSIEHDWNLQTEVSVNGGNLSSGERQIIILVKSLLSSAEIVVVDEVTSNMDGETATIAMQLLREYLVMQGKCVVVVCHRPSDMKQCDEVL